MKTGILLVCWYTNIIRLAGGEKSCVSGRRELCLRVKSGGKKLSAELLIRRNPALTDSRERRGENFGVFLISGENEKAERHVKRGALPFGRAWDPVKDAVRKTLVFSAKIL